MTSQTLTIEVPAATGDKLARLAEGTRRSPDALAAEALETYLTRELEVIEALRAGLADVAAGRMAPHDAVVADMDTIVAEAKARRGA